MENKETNISYSLSEIPVVPVMAEVPYFKEGKGFKEFAENDLPYLIPVIEKMLIEENGSTD